MMQTVHFSCTAALKENSVIVHLKSVQCWFNSAARDH